MGHTTCTHSLLCDARTTRVVHGCTCILPCRHYLCACFRCVGHLFGVGSQLRGKVTVQMPRLEHSYCPSCEDACLCVVIQHLCDFPLTPNPFLASLDGTCKQIRRTSHDRLQYVASLGTIDQNEAMSYNVKPSPPHDCIVCHPK